MTRRKRKRTLARAGPPRAPPTTGSKTKTRHNNLRSSLTNLNDACASPSPWKEAGVAASSGDASSIIPHHRPHVQQRERRLQRRRHVCLHCNRFFTFRPFFLSHLKLRHRRIRCKKCCKYFVFRSVYIRHILRVHGSRLRRKSSSMDSDGGDSLASSASGGTTLTTVNVSPSTSSKGRLAWLYSPDTFDFVCPHCFYESFNEHDIRTHVFSCHWKSCPHESPSKIGCGKASLNVEVLKQVDTNVSSLRHSVVGCRYPATIPAEKSESRASLRFDRDSSSVSKRLEEEKKSPKITKISRSAKRENLFSKPSFKDDDDKTGLRHLLPCAFDDDDGDGSSKSHSRSINNNDNSVHDIEKISSRLMAPETARTRASDDDDDLHVNRRKSGDLCQIGDDHESSIPDTNSPSSEGTAKPRRRISDVVPGSTVVDERIDGDDDDHHRGKSLDLANIDTRVDFASSESMGSFLKEVIDFLSDGTEEDIDASQDDKLSPPPLTKSRSPSSASPGAGDIGVTRIRSKRIACQQQKGAAAKSGQGSSSPKKIVEFVSLEDDGDPIASTSATVFDFPPALPGVKLEKEDFFGSSALGGDSLDSKRGRRRKRRRRRKKVTSDIQKMLLAYSCDTSGNLIVRPSQFAPAGVSYYGSAPASVNISPNNPFSVPSLDNGAAKLDLDDDESPSNDADSSQVLPPPPPPPRRQRRKAKRKRRESGEADANILELTSGIDSCSLTDLNLPDIEDSPLSNGVEQKYPLLNGDSQSRGGFLNDKTDDGALIEKPNLRKRVSEKMADVASKIGSHSEDEVKRVSLAPVPKKGLLKKQLIQTLTVESQQSPCCTKPLSASKANRLIKNEVKPAVGGKDRTIEVVSKRVKVNSSQSLKENDNGSSKTTTADWRWPPQVNDMVVGLFEDGWYIGKALEIMAKGDKVKIKFMEDRNFKVTQRFWKWPRVNDIQVLVKCSILNVRPEVKLLDKAKGECTKNLSGGVYEVTNLAQIQAQANEFYKRKRPTAPDVK